MAMINYLGEQMEYSVFGGTPPRLEIPRPAAASPGPITFNNIHVDRRVVGAINTGEIQKLDVSLSHIKQGGEEELLNVLKQLTEAILNDPAFPVSDKNAAVEHLTYLAEQAELPKANRKISTAKTVLAGLERLLSGSANLTRVWSAAQP